MESNLTEYQREVLAQVEADKSYERDGDGPWERGWFKPTAPAQSKALATLADHDLIEVDTRNVRRWGVCRYRSKRPLSQAERDTLRVT